ncbi:hypothetical protein [Olivibacter domesticus]|nr:hypothetical protein [Olivibacter domesticus]
MMNKRRTLGFGIGILLVLLFIFKDVFFLPNVESLKGEFHEVTFVRNEQNTGPVIRLYVVSVGKKEDAQFEAYGNFMPHTKYGITTVFFFDKKSPIPRTISENEPYFNTVDFKPIAKYEKNPMGNTSLTF